MSIPLITAIVDTFNHENFVEQAVNSVLDQGFSASDLEVLVVDDGSTDRTADIVEKFAGSVQIYRKKNGGQGSAFNAAIPLARGEIVAFLDGDDWWAKDKLAKVVGIFGSDPDIGVVGHGFYEFDEALQRPLAVVPASNHQIALKTVGDGIAFRDVMCFFGTSRVAIRKRVLDLVGTIPNALVIEADEFMSTVAVAKSQAMLLKQPLTFYRLHSGNLYQFRGEDADKIRRKMTVLVELSAALRRELPSALLDDEVIDAVLQPIDVEAQCLKLSLVGGTPWETFRVERAGMRLAYKQMNWKYRIFKRFVLALTLVLPPKSFYKVRAYYAKMNLRRLRRFTGEPIPVAPVHHYEGGDDAK
jgi:glycosyltransferase involved in cell wall biosynthesis